MVLDSDSDFDSSPLLVDGGRRGHFSWSSSLEGDCGCARTCMGCLLDRLDRGRKRDCGEASSPWKFDRGFKNFLLFSSFWCKTGFKFFFLVFYPWLRLWGWCIWDDSFSDHSLFFYLNQPFVVILQFSSPCLSTFSVVFSIWGNWRKFDT